LCFSNASPGPRLDEDSPLHLGGGFVQITGSDASHTQRVSSVVVQAGESRISSGMAKGAFLCGEITREGVGGVITLSSGGGTTVYIGNQNNTQGYIGGWALEYTGDPVFVAAGVNGAIDSPWSNQAGGPDGWWNVHLTIAGSGVATKNAAAYLLRYTSGFGAITTDMDSFVLILQGGGIVNAHAGTKIHRGFLRSGYETGELFVHTSTAMEISSAIQDNGPTPLILVKSLAGKLTLSGALEHTGDTYLNGGTLSLIGAGASLATPIHQAGGTWLELANGASLVCDNRALNGNLRLGADATLALALGGASAPLTLANPFATLDITADETNPVVLQFNPAPNFVWLKGTYPLVALASGVASQNLAPEHFAPQLPGYVHARVETSASGVNLTVTRVANGALLLLR
jgi:autotransporter-associated beta strand protein